MFINELFLENKDDDMFAPAAPGKYWNNTPEEFNQLYKKLIPDSGACETLEGELLRSANRLYYDYYNNGFGNNVSGAENFLRNFGGSSHKLMQSLNILHPYTRGANRELHNNPSLEQRVEIALDAMMDVIFYQVLAANNNNDFHKSPGDMFDYSEKDDPYYDEDDGGYDEWEDDEEVDESTDGDMFASTRVPPDAQRQIYEYGLGLLRTLEEEGTRAMQNPKIAKYYNDAHDDMDGGGADMLFSLVLQLTGAPFEKAYVVDEWIRESGYEGLIDFGWMIEGGDYGDLWQAWDAFGKDQSLRTSVDFKQSARKFFKDSVNENDDMFASHIDRILAKFEFPEDGPLGYMLGGGIFDAGFGRNTDGLTIVDREDNSIAFMPDFTYFDEEPTQEQLEELFYDEASERMPITSQMVQKVRSISEASFQFDLDDEPEPPKKTQTRDKPKFNHDPFQQQAAQPLANRPEEPQRGAEPPAAPRMRQATAANTRRAAGNVAPTDQMRDMLSRMRDIEIDPDLADYPSDEPTLDITTEVNTENLPAVAGQAIAAAGETSPEFHQVARLPGNMSRMIRQLGKSLFGSMTHTPTEEIYMIGNLGGQGPNTRMEVNAVANFVRENGDDMGPGDIDFEAVMPGYTAQTHQYSAAGVRWLLVKDMAGEYIYAWPESDSKTTSNQAQLGNEPRRIR